ncbi:hypothetical protein IFR05_011484, partial [Cadophora sp. M221]
MAATTSTNPPTRPSKRRRTSISQRTIEPTSTPDSHTLNLTSRPRRQAAIKSRAQSRFFSYANTNSKSTASSRKPNTNSKSKTSSKKKSKAKAKKAGAVEDEEEEEEEQFECPCDLKCENIAICESRKKEAEVRDVGMNIILSSRSTVIIKVGISPNQQSFIIHKELLEIHSEYFASLFSNPECSNSSQLSEQSKDISQPNKSSALGNALAGAMHVESLDSKVKVQVKGEIHTNLDADDNIGLGIKMEIDDEDSDDDFTMISSDQYYSNLSRKKFPTPPPAPPPPLKSKSTSSSISSSPSNINPKAN